MEYLYLYLLGNDLSAILWLIFMIYTTIMIITGFTLLTADYKEKGEKAFCLFKKNTAPYIILFLVAVLYPSKATLTYIGSYYVGKQVAQSETTQKLVDLLNKKIDEQLNQK